MKKQIKENSKEPEEKPKEPEKKEPEKPKEETASKKAVKTILDAKTIVQNAWMRPCPNMCLLLNCPFFETCWKFKVPEEAEE